MPLFSRYDSSGIDSFRGFPHLCWVPFVHRWPSGHGVLDTIVYLRDVISEAEQPSSFSYPHVGGLVECGDRSDSCRECWSPVWQEPQPVGLLFGVFPFPSSWFLPVYWLDAGLIQVQGGYLERVRWFQGCLLGLQALPCSLRSLWEFPF